MSEYQYYEFRAIDRPLGAADQAALRRISSRAQISTTRFKNDYHWGDFKGDPAELMEQWFDLHLYFANWGTRRLMMKVPTRFLEETGFVPFVDSVDWVETWTSGDNLIIDISRDEEDPDYDPQEQPDWLDDLEPLRADLLAGDLRFLYLLWLGGVDEGEVPDDALEPLPGLGPISGALDACAEFFRIGWALVAAATERDAFLPEPTSDLRNMVAALPDADKTTLLLRVAEGDPHVAAELARRSRGARAVEGPRRTAGELRARAGELEAARDRADAERAEADRRRRAAEEERALRTRLEGLRARGDDVWREIETEIGRRNAAGYDRAAALLKDLNALATAHGDEAGFARRLADIRARHENKRRFIERLVELGPARRSSLI